jgi:hypothetical protein
MLSAPYVAQVTYMLIFHMCFAESSWFMTSFIKWISWGAANCFLYAPAELHTIHFPLEYVCLPELIGYRIGSTFAKARLGRLFSLLDKDLASHFNKRVIE